MPTLRAQLRTTQSALRSLVRACSYMRLTHGGDMVLPEERVPGYLRAVQRARELINRNGRH